jgi:multiple sugar transport system permease protein
MTVTTEGRRGRISAPAFALPRRRSRTLKAQRARAGMAFAAPAAVIVGLFFLVPLGLSLWISLHRWPLIAGEHTFNAPDNYKAVKDQLFKDAVVFTLKYTLITTVFLSLVAFALALLAQESRRLRGLFRTTYFLPAAVGLAASSLIFYALYNETQGPLNDMLEWTGLVGPINWLGTPNNALLSTVGMVTWRFAGFYMLIILTGLQAIPTDVYEAARVDGAGWWRTLRSITLPLLRPTLALMLILSVTGSILAFDQFYILTNGGPDNSTITVVLAIYRQAFFLFDLGKGAALSIIVLVILLALNIVQFRILRTSDEE